MSKRDIFKCRKGKNSRMRRGGQAAGLIGAHPGWLIARFRTRPNPVLKYYRYPSRNLSGSRRRSWEEEEEEEWQWFDRETGLQPVGCQQSHYQPTTQQPPTTNTTFTTRPPAKASFLHEESIEGLRTKRSLHL